MSDPLDVSIWRGSNAPPLVFQFPFDIAGSAFVLTLRWRGGGLTLSSQAGELTVDAAAGRVAWAYSPAQSRLIPAGRLARYELERRLPGGEQRTYAFGALTGLGGDNDD